jgi:hypothetical protein
MNCSASTTEASLGQSSDLSWVLAADNHPPHFHLQEFFHRIILAEANGPFIRHLGLIDSDETTPFSTDGGQTHWPQIRGLNRRIGLFCQWACLEKGEGRKAREGH